MSLTDQPDSPVIEMSYVTAGVDPLQNYELTNDFYAMTTEVTQGMFTELMGYDAHTYSTAYGVLVNG